MNSKHQFETFDQFAQALAEASVTHTVVRLIHEIRPSYGDGFQVVIGPVHRGELLAYHQGQVYQCFVEGAALEHCTAALEARGIRLKKVSGNVT